jgi:hypothetical protein
MTRVDQGVVAMWTAAITGFASAAGAVLGAGMSGRGNLKVADHQRDTETEREGRNELKGRVDKFQTKVTTLDQASKNVVNALRAGKWTKKVQKAYEDAIHPAEDACRTDIYPYASPNIRKAANLVDTRIRVLIEAVAYVRANPSMAMDLTSEPSKKWLLACGALEAARNDFASAVGAEIGFKS